MDPSAMKNEQSQYPEGSEVKKIDERNKAINKILMDLGILEQNNTKHPSVEEIKLIQKNTQEELNLFKQQLELESAG